MNRGSQAKQLRLAGQAYRFNEAPIHESGKYDEVGHLPDVLHDRASMRPRFMNRGSVIVDLARAVREQASMRPRFMNRGSHRERERERTPR